ncbi:MAG: LytTR family DNA-binding domain-containing protein [Clostridia bacterium]|nr:LytTR family DNA-binding domain-containing protein [Clostridia bacterium]
MELKVLIADDDEGMRLILSKVVNKTEGFKLVGQVGDGEAALLLAEELRPQIIFIDIDMPKLDGMECARRIADILPKTFFIFATAHEEYMSDAFEIYAADYIVKPFKVERITKTLERIKGLYKEQESVLPFNKQIYRHKGLEKLVIRNKEGVSFVDMEEIILIQREDRSTVVITGNERYVTSEGLSEIEMRLDGGTFFRSHKSYIINLTMIHKVYPYGRWTYIVKFKGTGKDALITHDKYEELQKMF